MKIQKKTYENILNLLNLDGGLIVSGTPVSKVLTSVNPPALIVETISVKSTVLKTGNSRYPSINVSNGAVSVSQGLPGNLSAVFDNDTMKEIALKLFNGLISVSITNQFTLKVSITSKLSLGKKNYYAKNSIIFEFRIDTARKPPNGNATNVYPTWEELITTMNANIKEYEKASLTKQEKIALATLVTIGVGIVLTPFIPTLITGASTLSLIQILPKLTAQLNNL